MLGLFVTALLAQAPAATTFDGPRTAPARQDGMRVGKGTTLAKVVLSQPTGGWTVGRMLTVAGSLTDSTIDPVVVSINGDRYLMRTFNGQFKREFPASAGKNIVTVLATNRAGTASAQATSYAQIAPVPLKVVLTSDTDGVYTDLHLYEPTLESQSGRTLDGRKMAHVYWADTRSPSGGTFFLNEQGGDFDQPGYGPYLYIHRAPPKGIYLVATNYWPSGDKAHTVASLNLTLFEGTPQEVKRAVRIPLATPGSTKVLAWVNILGSGRALIYLPSADAAPTDERWPANLAEVAKALGGGDGEFDQ